MDSPLVIRLPLRVHIGTGVCRGGREISQCQSVIFLPNQASSASACVWSPSQGHRDATSFHCALGPLGPTLKCVSPHSWDTSRLFWPDCPWQWVCRCRWLVASVPALPLGLDLPAAQVSAAGGADARSSLSGLSTVGQKFSLSNLSVRCQERNTNGHKESL